MGNSNQSSATNGSSLLLEVENNDFNHLGNGARNNNDKKSRLRQSKSAERGKELLETFDKARTDFAVKYGGNDEAETIAFCRDLLVRGAPDLSAKYAILSTISCGTTSVVCKAKKVDGSGFVAIKYARLVVSVDGGHTKIDQRRQFEVEAIFQRKCSGKEVVELLDYRTLDSFAIFIMEYLPTTLLEATVNNNRSGTFHELIAARVISLVFFFFYTTTKIGIIYKYFRPFDL